MHFTKTTLAISVSLALTACGGGGGGGGGGNPLVRPDTTPVAPQPPVVSPPSTPTQPTVPFYTPTRAEDFTPLVSTGNDKKFVVSDIFAQDLNKDSVQEVVIGGRQTQPATVANWHSSQLQIYGWNTGNFAKETSTWFRGSDNVILGTEPSIKFGDFNGDGNVDMFVAPSTDMEHYSNGVVYFNSGSSTLTRTELPLSNVWGHDSIVKDFNGDGLADIMVTSYNGNMVVAFGNRDGSFSTFTAAAGTTGSSSVSVADYLGNGTNTIIMTDTNATGNQDTKLYSWSVTSGRLVLTEIAALPASRFYLSKWDSARTASRYAPHEIRNISMDFNGDGKMDVIVVSTLPSSGDDPYTEIQFLKNNGNGSFADVTDSVLVNYNPSARPSYQPRLIDVNKDGLLDIFLGANDYVTDQNAYNSSKVLLATSDGKFVESYGSVFRDFWNQISSSTENASDQGQPLNIVQGPNGDMYLVGTVLFVDNEVMKTAVYAAKIGSNGTVTAQATADAISTIWPYLTAAEANQVLAQSSSLTLDGVPVIDLTQAMMPIGDLAISYDGRKGKRISIQGTIQVPGLNSNLLSNLSAVDTVGRDFRVSLESLAQKAAPMPVSYSLVGSDTMQMWSNRFVTENLYQSSDLTFSGYTIDRFSTSMTNRMFDREDPWLYRVGLTRLEGSPWFGFNGVFGKINYSTMLDLTAGRKWSNGYWVQGGIMQTSTDFTPGLVQDITPLWAGYLTTGWQDDQWSVYGGVQPTLFAGSMTLNLPTSVDNQGTMHYTQHAVEIRNQPVLFAGFEHKWQKRNNNVTLSAVINDQGQYLTKFSYGYRF